MEVLWILWPITGWICAFASTPKWMFRDDPFGIFLALFCGGVAGPIGVFWFFDSTSTLYDK